MNTDPEGSEADELIRSLGFDPERFRTDGGAINHMKLAAAIKHPGDYAGLRVASEESLPAGGAWYPPYDEISARSGITVIGNQPTMEAFARAAIDLFRERGGQVGGAGSDIAVGLHPATADMIDRFAVALKEKLLAAQVKYGYMDGWLNNDWMNECRAKLLEHIAKGDPRDVANYCAFLWHHGERTVGTDRELVVRGSGTSQPAVAGEARVVAWEIEGSGPHPKFGWKSCVTRNAAHRDEIELGFVEAGMTFTTRPMTYYNNAAAAKDAT